MAELAARFELGVPAPRLGFGAMRLPGPRDGPLGERRLWAMIVG